MAGGWQPSAVLLGFTLEQVPVAHHHHNCSNCGWTMSKENSCGLPENQEWGHLSDFSLLLCPSTLSLLLVKSWGTSKVDVIGCQLITTRSWLFGNVRYLLSQTSLHDPILGRDLKERSFFLFFFFFGWDRQEEGWECWTASERDFSSCTSQGPSRKQMAHSGRVIKENLIKWLFTKFWAGLREAYRGWLRRSMVGLESALPPWDWKGTLGMVIRTQTDYVTVGEGHLIGAVAFGQGMQPTGGEEETKCNWKAEAKGGYLGLGRLTCKAHRGHRREKNIYIFKVLPEKRERKKQRDPESPREKTGKKYLHLPSSFSTYPERPADWSHGCGFVPVWMEKVDRISCKPDCGDWALGPSLPASGHIRKMSSCCLNPFYSGIYLLPLTP